MTGKELVIPITLALSIGGSAVLISNSYGRQAQALLGVQQALAQIQTEQKELDRSVRSETSERQKQNLETATSLADLKARMSVLEDGKSVRDMLDKRFLAHLEAKGD